MVIDRENNHLNQVIRVTAGANTEREVKKPRIRLVANMHGDYDHNYNYDCDIELAFLHKILSSDMNHHQDIVAKSMIETLVSTQL